MPPWTATAVIGGAAVLLLGNTLVTAGRSSRPSARPFAAIVASLILWAVCVFVPELSGFPGWVTTAWLWEAGASVGTAGLAVAWLTYTRRYTGHDRLLSVGVGTLAVLLAVALVLMNLPGDETGLLAGAVGVLAVIGMLVAVVYGAVSLWRLAGRHDRVSRRQVALLVAAVGMPYATRFAVGAVAVVRFAFDEVPVEQTASLIPLSELPVGFLLSGLLFAVSVRRLPVLVGFPRRSAVARATVVRDLQEPVVVVDYDERILDVNDSAVTTFGWDQTTVTGTPLSEVEPALASLPAGSTDSVRLVTDAGRRQFQYSVSAVGQVRSGGDPIARAVVLRDVTDRRTKEQRLSVLTRVLRHNIRNDLDVVLAYANEIEDPAIRDPIRDTARELVSLADNARDAERAMAVSEGSRESVDLVALVRSVAREYDDRAAIRTELPDQLTVTTHESVVERVVRELVENAVVHNHQPTVEVTLTAEPETITLRIADDGAGIPKHDREVVNSTGETQLNHGTGLGLWFVRWAVTRLGGDVTFDTREPTGTLVTVRLSRRADETDAAAQLVNRGSE